MDWLRSRIETHRWFGLGPMYPLYREVVRRVGVPSPYRLPADEMCECAHDREHHADYESRCLVIGCACGAFAAREGE